MAARFVSSAAASISKAGVCTGADASGVPESAARLAPTGGRPGDVYLTVKGNTKPISFEVEVSGPVQDPWGHQRIGLEGSVVVNRKDFGLNWNVALEAGGVLVSDKVTLEFEVAAVKSA